MNVELRALKINKEQLLKIFTSSHVSLNVRSSELIYGEIGIYNLLIYCLIINYNLVNFCHFKSYLKVFKFYQLRSSNGMVPNFMQNGTRKGFEIKSELN